MIDLLDTPAEVLNFFQEHPTSVVLVIEGSTDRIFTGNEHDWQARIMRELRVGRHLYIVVGSPLPLQYKRDELLVGLNFTEERRRRRFDAKPPGRFA
jgi:hypothetical protein